MSNSPLKVQLSFLNYFFCTNNLKDGKNMILKNLGLSFLKWLWNQNSWVFFFFNLLLKRLGKGETFFFFSSIRIGLVHRRDVGSLFIYSSLIKLWTAVKWTHCERVSSRAYFLRTQMFVSRGHVITIHSQHGIRAVEEMLGLFSNTLRT